MSKKIREKELKIVLDKIELYPHTKILEVGCGSCFRRVKVRAFELAELAFIMLQTYTTHLSTSK